jgi:predicted AAA+ superfamily ATPase
MIKRFIENDLAELLTEFPAVAIVGPRQVGKTTLVKSLEKQIAKEVIYIDLENPRHEIQLTDPILFFENNEDKCVVLDEIQRRKDLFPILRSMIDQNRIPSRFVLLGSASPELIRDSSESLAGRIFYKELTPLHLIEFESDDERDKRLLIRGGFPNSLLAKSDKMSGLWRESFIQTYIEKDLPLLGLPLSPSESRRLLRMVSHIHGHVINFSSLSKSLGVSSPSVKKYIHYLEHAFLIELLEPYSGNSAKRIVKSPKIYIRDSGIVNYLVGINNFNDFLSHPSAGNIWEGFVLQQIKSILPYNVSSCFYRTSHGAEIDLILSFPNQKHIGVEIKLSSSPSLSKGNYEAMSDLGLTHLYVIIPTNDTYSLKENVHVINLRGFIREITRFTSDD